MNILQTNGYTIQFKKEGYEALNQYIAASNPSKIVLLTDENTHAYCQNHFLSKLNSSVKVIITSIPSGETHKNIHTCIDLWNFLSQNNIDRSALMINLGGGVITDIGGFVASTHIRGIQYINIPTTLLSMVDASIGGKTGIDLGLLKNQVGLIINPKMVIVDPFYLNTLPKAEIHSGVAEILKHGLIHSEDYWKLVTKEPIQLNNLIDDIIYESILIKKEIVEKDPGEKGLRKSLNYGHTLGHAIETYSLSGKYLPPLLHGEAVAIGLILETYLSHKIYGFPKQTLSELCASYTEYYEKINFNKEAIDEILPLMKFDKKNKNGNINFVFLEAIGKPLFECRADNNFIYNAFDFYANLK
tara:strand:+ start:87884 stop:88957 length:1074 start_codon:yes stop_codon:yes gene_type:complete